MTYQLPTDEERWELVRRCVRLIDRSPRERKTLVESMRSFLGSHKQSKRLQIGNLQITKYYGGRPSIELRYQTVGPAVQLIFQAPAKQIFSRRLEHFEWPVPDAVLPALKTLRDYMVLDDLADV